MSRSNSESIPRRITTGIAVLAITGLIAGCASLGGSLGGGDEERVRAAIAAAGVAEITVPEQPVLEGEVVGFEGRVRLPGGWRISRTGGADDPAVYDVVNGDGRVRGAMALLDDNASAREIGTMLIAAGDRPPAEAWTREIDRDLEIGVVRPLDDQRWEVTIVVERRRAATVVVATVINPVPADYATLAAVARSLEPHAEDRRMYRTFAVGPVAYSVRLRDYEWVSDVSSQGGVFVHRESGLPVVITRENPQDSAGFGDLEYLPPDPDVTTSNYVGPHRFLTNPRLTHVADAVSWSGSGYHISRTRGDDAVWLIIPREIGSLGLSNFTLGPMVLNMINTDVGIDDEDATAPAILRVEAPDRRGVAILPVIRTVDGAVAEQIERLLTETVNSAVRLAGDQPIVDASTVALTAIPESPDDTREALARISQQSSAQWITAVEIAQGETASLPTVRVIIYNARPEADDDGVTEIQSELASLFDVFPLVDEVSAGTVGTITDTTVAFGSLRIDVPEWATGVEVTIDGRVMPAGQVSFERFPTGTYQVVVTQQRGGRPVRFADVSITVETDTAVTVDAPIPRLTDNERSALATAAAAEDPAAFFRRVAELPVDADTRRAIVAEFDIADRLTDTVRAELARYEFSLLRGAGRPAAVSARLTEVVGTASDE